jgi:uncharacterized protein YhaN
LLDILANTFENARHGVLAGECKAELINAVAGIDLLLAAMTERLDQQKQLIIDLESNIDRLENRMGRNR